MALPILIAGGALAAGGLASSIYGATRKTTKAQAPIVQSPAFGAGGDLRTQRYRNDLGGADAQARQEADARAAAANEARGMQGDLYARYGDLAAGRGPSLARAQAAAGLDRAQAQAGQTAASVRGGAANQLAAQRYAVQQGADLAGQVAGQSAALAQQEQLAAMGAQGQLAAGMREGDLQAQSIYEGRARDRLGAQMAMEQAQLGAETQTTLANQQAQQWAQGQNREDERQKIERWMRIGGGMMQQGGQVATAGMGK